MSSAWGVLLGSGLIAGAWLGPVSIPIVLGIALLAALVRGELRILALAIVIIAAAVGVVRGSDGSSVVLPDDLSESSGGSGNIVSLPSPSPSGDRVVLKIDTIDYPGSRSTRSEFRVMVWLPDDVKVAPGDRLSVTWSIDDISRIDPGFGAYVQSQGADAVGRVATIEDIERAGSWMSWLVSLRRTLSSRFESVLPGDVGALASGIVTGDDSGLSDPVRDAFLRTGTSHITAVSGSNVSMLLALWNILVRPGRFRRLVLVQVAIIATIWMYAVLVGLEPPAVRAALVASLGLLAVRAGRHPDPMTLLFLASAGLVMWNPATTDTLSFWLSFIASAAIIGQLPVEAVEGWTAGAKAIGTGIFAAYLGTLPVVLATFGTWSMSAIVANAILAPLMMVAFPLSFTLGFVLIVLPEVAGIIAWIPGIVLRVAIVVVEGLSKAAFPLEFGTTGWIGVVSVGILCAVITLGFSRDGRRWTHLVVECWQSSRTAVLVLALASLAGAAVGAILAMVR
jgi:competence protein ComEC